MEMALNNLSQSNAFTLIELTIALFMALVVCSGIYALSFFCIRFYYQYNDLTWCLCGTELVLDALRRDCLSACNHQPLLDEGIMIVHQISRDGVCRAVHICWQLTSKGIIMRTHGNFDHVKKVWSKQSRYHMECSLQELKIKPVNDRQGLVSALIIVCRQNNDNQIKKTTVRLRNRVVMYE